MTFTDSETFKREISVESNNIPYYGEVPYEITDKLWSWASILEPKTESQACETAKMPFIHPHMALMPDAHLGMGATVGSVIPTRKAIMPAAVGVDIGCGMIAVLTQFTREHVGREIQDGDHPLSTLREMIEQKIPLGKGQKNTTTYNGHTADRQTELRKMRGAESADAVMPAWDLQLGTLGGGNHFIECSYDELDRVWLFLHSGSRGPGNKLAQKHIKISQELCRKWQISLPNRDLAYLPQGTPEFDDYLRDLFWAQKFALLNRSEMMERLEDAFSDFMGERVRREQEVNCHHNYTEHGKIWGQDVWLSRKGAIDATEGKLGLIPGSMGDLSFVVSGLGNRQALCSAPHGAGRMFSRSSAKKNLSFEKMQKQMADKGIEWRNSVAFLDEHPDAYKPIEVVMENASSLVKIEHTLHQFVNVKGE